MKHNGLPSSIVAIHLCAALCGSVIAQQPTIKYLIPDAAAPGMCVQIDIVASKDSTGAFGSDGAFGTGAQVLLVNPDDSARVRVGPSVVRHAGRLLHTMMIVNPNATVGPVPIRVRTPSKIGNIDTFFIVNPQHIGQVGGGYATLGDGSIGHGRRSRRGTIVADSMILNSGTYGFATNDPDNLTGGNQGYLPVTVLLTGRFVLDNLSTLSLDGIGANGGPGGGGGQGNLVVPTCPTPPVPADPGNGYAAGVSWGGSSSGTGTANGGKSLSGTAAFEGGGVASPFVDGTFGGGGGKGTVDANHIVGGGGGGGNATGGGNANSGATTNNSYGFGSPDVVPLAGGGGGGGGAADGSLCPAGGRGGGGAGAVLLAAEAGISVIGDVSAIGAAGGNAQCSGTANAGGGGGGGGGGAIVFASAKSVDVSGRVSAIGGSSGSPCGVDGFGGGEGGDGKIRIDGPQTGGAVFTPVVRFHGSSVAARSLTMNTLDTIIGTGNSNDSVAIWLMNISNGVKRAVGPFGSHIGPSGTFGCYIPADSLKRATSDSMIAVVSAHTSTDLPTSSDTWVMGQASARVINLPHGLLLPRDGPRDTTLDFGKVNEGDSVKRTIIFVNEGSRPITISSIHPMVTLGFPTFIAQTPVLPARVLAGGTLSIRIMYTPSDSNAIDDSLALVPDEPGATTAFLRVHGGGSIPKIQPQIRLEMANTLQFNTRSVGDTVIRTLPIRNAGSDTVRIVDASVIQGVDMHVIPPVAFTLPPLAVVNLKLFASYTTEGFHSDVLSIECEGTDTLYHVLLVGEVLNDTIGVPSRLCVPDSGAGDTTRLICNATGKDLVISSQQMIRGSLLEWTLLSAAASPIANGDCKQFTVRYNHPNSDGTLRFTFSNGGTREVTLSNTTNCSTPVLEPRAEPRSTTISAYPNPIQGTGWISVMANGLAIESGRGIQLIDRLGRVVLWSVSTPVDVSELPAGVYGVRVGGMGEPILGKVVVVR